MAFSRWLTFLASALVSVLPSPAQSNVKRLNLTFTTIDVPGQWIVNSVNGINNMGDMVGHYAPSNGSGLNYHGFKYSNGIFTYFDYPGADTTYGFGINDSGLIVGAAEFHGGLTGPGFIYDGVTYTLIRVPNQPVTNCLAINNAGEIVGNDGDFSAFVSGFKLRNGQFSKLHFPKGYDLAHPSAINNDGNIAVTLLDASIESAYVFTDGRWKNLNFPGALETGASGINDNGIVVGYYFLNGQFYGFAFKGGKYVSFAYPGAMYTTPSAINNAGQIVGAYQLSDFTWHGFVTSPITDADFQ